MVLRSEGCRLINCYVHLRPPLVVQDKDPNTTLLLFVLYPCSLLCSVPFVHSFIVPFLQSTA